MRILKMKKFNSGYAYIVDEIPKVTYEEKRGRLIGTDKQNILRNDFVEKHERHSKAFSGREFRVEMKDGSYKTLKDVWWDFGIEQKDRDKYINVTIRDLESLQNCYVFTSYYVNKDVFTKLVDEYLKYDKVYAYDEIEEWVNLQYTWYPLILNGKETKFVVNKRGNVRTKYGKNRVYASHNVCRYKYSKGKNSIKFRKTYKFIKFDYNKNGDKIKVSANWYKAMKDSLPKTEFEFLKTTIDKDYYKPEWF